jgi:hypothetical protein
MFYVLRGAPHRCRPRVSTFKSHPSVEMAAAADRICVGRLCGDEIRAEGRAIRFMEKRCTAACAADSDLCTRCLKNEAAYMTKTGPLKFHGRFGMANIPEGSHVQGSAWNVATRAKEDARMAKAAVAVAANAAGASAAPVKKAKAAAKKAATSASNTATAARAAIAEQMTAMTAAANAAAGVAPMAAVAPKIRKASAKAKRVVEEATLTREQASAAIAAATELIAGAANQSRAARRLRRTVRAHAGLSAHSSNRSTSRRSTSGRSSSRRRRHAARRSSSSSRIYRPASAGSGPRSNSASAAPAMRPAAAYMRGASPEEKRSSERQALQDKIIANIMAAQTTKAGGAGGNLL